jgi:hypothetical protein
MGAKSELFRMITNPLPPVLGKLKTGGRMFWNCVIVGSHSPPMIFNASVVIPRDRCRRTRIHGSE